MTKVAAVDCGTNSIRLLIAESKPGDGLIDIERRTEIVRLGQGVDSTGEFHPDALLPDLSAVSRRMFFARGGWRDEPDDRAPGPGP